MNKTVNVAVVTYFGQQLVVACDRQCHKAWGINSRPKVQLSEDDDDYAYLADSELGDALADPGTYEGPHGKPDSPDDFPNKWCVRECERCEWGKPGAPMVPLVLRDYSKRVYNMPHLHGGDDE